MEKLNRLQQFLAAQINKRPRGFFIFILVFPGLLALAHEVATPRAAESLPSSTEGSSVDTFIPAGFVLVPIDVINFEALDSVLGQYGIVDLFAVTGPEERSRSLVASRIRILRAPKNPNHFAVLASSDEAANLVRHTGGFFVVLQNPNGSGTKLENKAQSHDAQPANSKRRSRRIKFDRTEVNHDGE